jgi:hypothetical protein
MRARVLAKALAVAFALSAGKALYNVAGIDGDVLHGLSSGLALVLVVLLIAETAWRLVWAAEDGERLVSWLPPMTVATVVPAGVALVTGHVALAVATGSWALALTGVATLVKINGRPAGKAVRS